MKPDRRATSCTGGWRSWASSARLWHPRWYQSRLAIESRPIDGMLRSWRDATDPEMGSEALRDLVRAREAAKQDQTRARHRLSKFLLRSGQRPPTGVKPWTRPYLIWVEQLRFPQMAQESTRQDYLHEIEHMRGRVARLEQAITEAVKLALARTATSHQRFTGVARYCRYLGCNHCERVGPGIPL